MRIANCELRILRCTALLVAAISCVVAQESPTPSSPEDASPTPNLTLAPTPTSTATLTPIATPTSSPTATPSAPPARNVRISFLPPPLEGKISLGIYDSSGKLVRVLHREAAFDDFTIGADALATKWDGKSDDGQDLPAGKYRARGYLVGGLKGEPISNSTPPDDAIATPNIQIKLMPNPLFKNARQTVDLGVGFDDKSSFLKTADGLPLFTIDEKSNLNRALIKKSGEKLVDVWEDGGGPVGQFQVSNIDKMMAFDCGEIELK